MKKHIIAILITTCTTSSFALDQMIINGKKVTMNDTRSTLIQKFGQPESGTTQFSNWTYGNFSLYANYNQRGLVKFSANQMNNKPSKASLQIDDKVIHLGKDTIKSATTKLKHGCYNFDEGRQGSTYSMTPTPTVNKRHYVVLETGSDAFDVKTISNEPINGLIFTLEKPESNQGCK